MHSWFTQKVNELIGLAHYCQFPIIKAHFILAQKAIDEMYGKESSGSQCLREILPLLVDQAEQDGRNGTAQHLREALLKLGGETSDTTEGGSHSEKILKADFSKSTMAKAKLQG